MNENQTNQPLSQGAAPNQSGQGFPQGYPNHPQGPRPGSPYPANPNYPTQGAPVGAQPGFPPRGTAQPHPPHGQPPVSGAGNHPMYAQTAKQPGKPPASRKPPKPKGDGFGRWVFLGILVFFLFVSGGAVLGYKTAISAREAQANAQKIQAASQQYQLALIDIENEKYENANTRLKWVIDVDPNYPGATQKYMELQVKLFPRETPTPMMTATPEPTPTVDLRGEADMLQTARSQMGAKDWAAAIGTLNALRDKNLEYESLAVDSLYYIALRHLGIKEIGDGYLEPGIYKITLSEAFGPIDAEANNSRLAARNYLAGAGFWEVNWEKALRYYSDAYSSNPFMYDRSSGKTAQDRYVQASYEYGHHLIAQYEPGTEDYCKAREYYNQSLAISLNDAVAATATAVQDICEPPTATPEIVAPPAETPTVLSIPTEPTPDILMPTEPPIIAPPTEPPAVIDPPPVNEPPVLEAPSP